MGGRWWIDVVIAWASGLSLRASAVAAGAWWLQQQAVLPNALWCYVLAAACVAVLLLSRSEARVSRCIAALMGLILCAAAGFLYASLRAEVRLAGGLPAALEGRDLRLTGVVAEMPQASDRGTRFAFAIDTAASALGSLPDLVSLTWYADDTATAALPELHAGQRWQLSVRLRRPHGTANPHGFDGELWLLERGIRAVGYVRPAGARLLDPMVQRPMLWVERAREAARARVHSAVGDAASAAVLSALAVGDQQGIAAADWALFTRTGVNHLISISGLHITMLAGLAALAVRFVWPRLGRAALWLPTPLAAAFAALIVAFAYALLAGFGVPAQRTVYMLGVVALALAVGRNPRMGNVLALALVVVVVVDPWAVMAAGFWLSFVAVALIGYVTAARIGRASALRTSLRVQWAITLGLVPLTIAFFQQVSLISPLANAFAIPLVSLLVVPATLAGLVLPGDLLLRLAAWLMDSCTWALRALSDLPEAVWTLPAPGMASLVFAALGIAWLLAPAGWPVRWLGLLGLLPLAWDTPAAPAAGEAWVDVLDVGQGLAVVVRTQRHVLVYDTGPRYGEDADSGARIVVPHLRGVGAQAVDALVVSHADNDHAGGLPSIFAATPVYRLVTSIASSSLAPPLRARHTPCAAGENWEWDGVAFTMLWPAPAGYNDSSDALRVRDNDRSCVLHVQAGGQRLLLTGDIEQRAEGELMRRYPDHSLAAEVLVVPHHGSNTSSTASFIDRVNPRIAIFSVGYRNRFGHPAQAVAARYRARGIEGYRSDRDGAVSLAMGTAVRVRTWRAAHARYWQGR